MYSPGSYTSPALILKGTENWCRAADFCELVLYMCSIETECCFCALKASLSWSEDIQSVTLD